MNETTKGRRHDEPSGSWMGELRESALINGRGRPGGIRMTGSRGCCRQCGKLVPVSENTRTPSGLMCASCRADVGGLGGVAYNGDTLANLSEFLAAKRGDEAVAGAELEMAFALAMQKGWA